VAFVALVVVQALEHHLWGREDAVQLEETIVARAIPARTVAKRLLRKPEVDVTVGNGPQLIAAVEHTWGPLLGQIDHGQPSGFGVVGANVA